MQQSAKPRKLWGSPKVLLSANELIIEEKYYPLIVTYGAFVELAPEVKPEPKAPETKPETPWTTMQKVLGIIAAIFIGIFLLLLWWDDSSSSSGGSNVKYRLVMVSDFGNVTALEHTNQKKLRQIAAAVNEALVARGITPQTGVYNAADAGQ